MRVRAIGAALFLVVAIGACDEDAADPSDAAATATGDSTEASGGDGATAPADGGATVVVGADTTTRTSELRSGATDTGATALRTTTGGAGSETTTTAATSATTDATSATTNTSAASSTTTTTAGNDPFQSQAGVMIQGRRFEPTDLGVTQRTRVTVTNADAEPHTWTSDSGEWNSGRIVAGGAFTHSFTRVGTFSYHCEIHPSMTGSVTVN